MRTSVTTDPVAALAVLLGALMIVAVPGGLVWLSNWAALYGEILVYLAFVEYLAVAVGLLRWGVGRLRSQRSPQVYLGGNDMRTVDPADSSSVTLPQSISIGAAEPGSARTSTSSARISTVSRCPR